MAEASLSEFFSPSILANSDSSDQEFDSIVGSLPFDFELPRDPPIAPPPTSSTLDTASAANELQRLKDKNKNKNTAKSTNTWAKRFTKSFSGKSIKGLMFQLLVQFIPNCTATHAITYTSKGPEAFSQHLIFKKDSWGCAPRLPLTSGPPNTFFSDSALIECNT